MSGLFEVGRPMSWIGAGGGRHSSPDPRDRQAESVDHPGAALPFVSMMIGTLTLRGGGLEAEEQLLAPDPLAAYGANGERYQILGEGENYE